MDRPRRGVSAFERIEAILPNPEVYELGELVPDPDPATGGRRRTYPDFMLIVYEALISVYGSARQVEAELAHPKVWSFVRSVRRMHPRRPDLHLPREPMRRHHYLYGRNRYLADPELLEQFVDAHRKAAARTARDVELLDPDGPGSFTHPHRSRLLYGDGKVVTPLFRAKPGETRVDPETGEVIPKRCIRRTTPLVPGATGVVYDTAFRGTHHQTLLRDLAASSRSTASPTPKPTPRSRDEAKDAESRRPSASKTRSSHSPDGSKTSITLYGRGGTVGIGRLDDRGNLDFLELRRVRTQRTRDKSGTYRWYNHYALPAEYGDATITVRLHSTADDTARGLNRTENVRPIPPTDPDFTDLFRRRNDAATTRSRSTARSTTPSISAGPTASATTANS